MSQNLAGNHFTADETEANTDQEEVFVFPASFAQQRLWFLHRLVPGNPFYNVGCALRLTGTLNLAALEETFNEIVRRHETLRTTFIAIEGQPMQAIAPCLKVSIAIAHLQHLPAAERATAARRRVKAEFERPFNLKAGPLIRVTLLQMDAAESLLLLNLHHIVADGWSMGVLIREIGVLYPAFAAKNAKLSNSPALPELPIQYADFAEWQREWLRDSVQETQLAYWRQQLEGIEMLNLPTDRPRPAVPTYRGAKQLWVLPPALSEALEALSSRQGVTLFITLLAAFQTLLYRYTGAEDIAIGSPIAGRNRSEIESLIGFFVNSLVLRTNLSGNPTFLELLSRVKEVALGAYAHQDLPFEKLVEELHPERDLSRNPLFQIAFSLQNTPVETLELPGLTLKLFEFDPGTAKLDLEFHLWQDLEGLKGQVVYSTDLFEPATISRMLGHFQILLENIIIDPEQHIGYLQILTEAERHKLLGKFNITVSQNRRCFHHLFEAQVERYPEAAAIVFENERLTYRELNYRANQLAHYLQKMGVKPEVLVGICLERSIEMIVALLGIFKAGGAYLPLDPSYPQERLNFMLEDAQVSILVTDSISTPLFWENRESRQHEFSIIYLGKDKNNVSRHSKENPSSNVTTGNLAYVIYTSGSTGQPKGVLVEHRGLCNLVESQIDAFNLKPSHRVLQFASLSFDASIFEIVMALQAGATLYLAKKESLLPGQPLIQLLQKQAITHITLPPAALAVLPAEKLPALQTIICAGESCSQNIVKRWAAGRRFFNAYGPTETTVWATLAEISDDSKKPSIGRPILNTQVYILDRNLQPAPIGITGELYIAGDGLARGYLCRPELTAERFIPNPFREKGRILSLQPSRLYKTGDLARYLPDGKIEFLGRIDQQVKIRGFRIELGEIEAVINQYPAIRKAVVIVLEDISVNQRIVAYLVSANSIADPSSLINTLRQFLKDKLPKYMVPSEFVILDTLPATPSGKVDRRALPAPNALTRLQRQKTFISPRTPTESALAKIWAEVLNVERVSVGDSFFDLGGDSLLAIRLMEQIHKQFSRELPLSSLFLSPTIESLANTLFAETKSLKWSPLVPIQPKGSNPPFFCVHPIFGVVFPYYELAYYLGENQPFYGLQPIGIDGEQSPLTRIEEMAAYYIKALRAVQPNGPYFLGGWSFGGLVAFEMAQQLQKAGEEVGLLALLDTAAPVAGNKFSFWNGCKFLFNTVRRSIWPFLLDYLYLTNVSEKHKTQSFTSNLLRLSKVFQLKNRRSLKFILEKAVMVNLMPQEAKLRRLNQLTIRSMFRVFQANSQATLSYTPKTYPNRITLFKSCEQGSADSQDPTMGWSELTESGTDVHLVTGNHLEMMKTPNVQVLAEQIGGYFNK
ncbi:non-ribosomal peptide synthetase [Microcoleus sp. FACHB-672]|uniref:non-ribosomal peptide synthetase n=1 Tax=Microcoleus sp. FACHB-672 TaxID=2692825 RepID=UPI00168204B5|nr:non-ribosomal peptide synthetase [Microcoleus sp. FACHB-672]MBD2041488.1 amino acid adenylation domain-containing protein [Microcoleus sp. FACHB-672]